MIWLLAGASWPAAGECIERTVRDGKRQAAFVFEGTVTRLTVVAGIEEAATIDTHRVWKGRVAPLVSVHFVPDALDGPSFTVAHRYVIFGVPETEARREVARLPAGSHNRTIWVSPCFGPRPVSPDLIEQLGRSKRPS